MTKKPKQPEALIQLLLDDNAEYGDRGDAAMDLSAFSGHDVEQALLSIASAADSDDDLADHCGESLAEIWCRNGKIDQDAVKRLNPVAKRIALATLRRICPELAGDAPKGD